MTSSSEPVPPLLTSDDDGAMPIGHARVLASIAGVLLLLVGGAVATMRPEWNRSSVWLPMTFGIAASLPFFAVAASMRDEPKPFALGAASALAWIAVLTLVAVPLVGLLAALFLAFGGQSTPAIVLLLGLMLVAQEFYHAMPPFGYVLLFALLVVGVALIRQLRKIARFAPLPSAGRIPGRLLVILYVIALAAFMRRGDTLVMTKRMEDAEAIATHMNSAPDSTRKAIRRTQQCLAAYHSAHPAEGYPPTLVALGPGGSGCIDDAVARGTLGVWQMRYVPNAPDSARRSADYWLVAEPTTAFGRGEIFYANASGVIYQTKDFARDNAILLKRSVPSSAVPPADSTLLAIDDSPVPRLMVTRRCVLEHLTYGTRTLPKTLIGNRCRFAGLDPDGSELTMSVGAPEQSGGPFGKYRVTYNPIQNVYDSSIVTFSMSARPATYGVDGLRSYLIDEAGVVHWTSEDREATLRDRVVSPCESSSGESCPYLGSLDTLKKGH